MCCEWVSVVGASKATSVASECIVISKCNIKEKNPAQERVYEIGTSVQGEGSNVIF